jgi:hypothetical protein
MMGGRLAVASEVGHGATFTFTVSVAMEIGDTVARNLNGLKVGVIAPAGRARDLLVQLMADWARRCLRGRICGRARGRCPSTQCSWCSTPLRPEKWRAPASTLG